MRGVLLSLPSGDAGTYATLQHMRNLARAGAPHPLVRSTAVAITDDFPYPDTAGQARAIRDWIDVHTEFLPDPAGVEALHQPAWLVRQILDNGRVRCDCDDVALLSASLALSIGLRARFVVVGFSRNAPYRHVWSELADASRRWWVTVDPTRALQGMYGLEVRRRAAMEV